MCLWASASQFLPLTSHVLVLVCGTGWKVKPGVLRFSLRMPKMYYCLENSFCSSLGKSDLGFYKCVSTCGLVAKSCLTLCNPMDYNLPGFSVHGISQQEYWRRLLIYVGFPGSTVVNNPLANAEDARDLGSVPGSGRSPGEGNVNPL